MGDFTDHLQPAEPQGLDTLTKERSQSDLPVKELASHLLSENGFLERQERILQEVVQEKLLSKETQQNLSRPERFKLGLARAKLLRRMADRLKWTAADHKMYVPFRHLQNFVLMGW
jgi:acyl-CoA oxidase